jgi:anti-anti-sigma factor
MGILGVRSRPVGWEPDPFRCRWYAFGDCAVVCVAGEIDLASSHTLVSETVTAMLDHSPRVIIDLGAVTFVDSSGVDALLEAHDLAKAAGGWVRIAAAGRSVWKVLRLTGTDAQFHPYRTAAEARGLASA